MLPRLLLLVLLAAAAACGDVGDGVPSDIDAEQVLRVNLPGEPSSLDPQRATDFVSHTVLRNIYSPLLRMGETLELEPAMAREVPTVANGGISEDGLTYTFRLRDGLKWSDGTSLTARDFVNGAKRLFEPGSGNYYVDFYRVLAAGGFNQQVQEFMRTMNPQDEADLRALQELESSVIAGLEVSAPDDATVVYRLNRPSPVFLLLASIWPLYPVRQDLIEQHGDRWTEAGKLVTNGPFVLQAWSRGQSLVLTRNPHYYGEAPIIETIEMDVIENGAIAFLAYRKGEIDVVVLGPAELVQVRESTGGLREEFRSYGLLVTAGIFFNTELEALSDVRVRQALAGALDRDEYAEVVRDGAVLPAYSWLPPGMPRLRRAGRSPLSRRGRPFKGAPLAGGLPGRRGPQAGDTGSELEHQPADGPMDPGAMGAGAGHRSLDQHAGGRGVRRGDQQRRLPGCGKRLER